MYDQNEHSNPMAAARMEDPRGAEGPKWRTEADGESAHGVCAGEEQATEATFVSLLWSGAKAVAAPFLSCLGSRGNTPEDTEEDIVVMCGEPVEIECQSACQRLNATSTFKETDGANQNGGSRFSGRPRGPVAENAANAKIAESWLGLAPTEKPHPAGKFGAKAGAAPSGTVTDSEPLPGDVTNRPGVPSVPAVGHSSYSLCCCRLRNRKNHRRRRARPQWRYRSTPASYQQPLVVSQKNPVTTLRRIRS
ncbi:hypothetical protein FKM82_026221 [Ascaphus truei]